ncbi:MAG: hypothetical protein JO040_05195 [Gemmatimonadetes bacterium]|nr:hypothetical protein [Gemmatimonadota bacterium]
MFSTRKVLLLAALLTAPAPALVAQTAQYPAPAAAGRPQQGMMRSPIARLLEQRDTLRLTAEQVTRLEAIDRDLQQQNQPYTQQLQQLRPEGGQRREDMSDADREAMRERFEQLRPLMEKMRSNNQAAMEKAKAVLTPEQQQLAQSLMPQRRPGGRVQGGWGQRPDGSR